MIGLPRETQADLDAISALARQILAAAPKGSRPGSMSAFRASSPSPTLRFSGNAR